MCSEPQRSAREASTTAFGSLVRPTPCGAGCRLLSTVSRLRVYHRVGAGRPIRVVWALEEVGADYEVVTISAEEGRSPEHRARHPLGRVPVLEDEQGPMFESTALVFHLAELYPEARLLPPPATHERAVVEGWSIFAMTELEAPAIESRRLREANADASAKAGARCADAVAVLEGALSGEASVPRWFPVQRRRHRRRRGAGRRCPRRRDRTVAHERRVHGVTRRAPGVATGVVEAGLTRASSELGKGNCDQRPNQPPRQRSKPTNSHDRHLRCAVTARLPRRSLRPRERRRARDRNGDAPHVWVRRVGGAYPRSRWLSLTHRAAGDKERA